MSSTSLSRKHTCLERGNRSFGVFVADAETSRRGNGLLRSMLRGPSGRQYGAVIGKGDVWQELDVVAEILDELDDTLSSGDDCGEIFSSRGVEDQSFVFCKVQLKALAKVLL